MPSRKKTPVATPAPDTTAATATPPARTRTAAFFPARKASDRSPMTHEVIAADLEAFRKSGFAVSSGDSNWLLDAKRRPLQEALADGIATAVGETGRLDPQAIADWLAARREAESALIGHQDLWARPI